MKNMKKLFTPLMLTLFLVLAAVPVMALAEGETAAATPTELHVALRVERPGLPEFQHGRVPRLGVLPALEHERAQPRHADHPRRPG